MKNKKILITALVVANVAIIVALLFILTQPKAAPPANTKSKNPVVILETSKGNIEVELYPDKANVTVANFLRYVEEGHYDGTVFHRVMNGFMIQGGGFLPDGTPKPVHEPIKLESNNGLKNEIGTIAMARTNVPDSATSQFFINVADNAILDYTATNPGYAVFGHVVSGMDVVNAIKAVQTETRGRNENWPVDDIVITRAYVKK